MRKVRISAPLIAYFRDAHGKKRMEVAKNGGHEWTIRKKSLALSPRIARGEGTTCVHAPERPDMFICLTDKTTNCMEQKEQKQPLSEQELEQVSGGIYSPLARMVCPLCNRYVTHLEKHQASGCSDYLAPGTPTTVF